MFPLACRGALARRMESMFEEEKRRSQSLEVDMLAS